MSDEFDRDVLQTESVQEVEKLASHGEDEPTEAVIVTQLSDEARLKMEVLQHICSAPDRKTRGERLQEGAQRLEKSVRTVQRLLKKYEEKGMAAITDTKRSDAGSYRIDQEWVDFIVKTYREGNKGSRKMTPAQVAIRVQARADELGLEAYPCQMSVSRVLRPIIRRKAEKSKIHHPGWHGQELKHKTRTGRTLEVKYSNHIWQCDHTKFDIMLVDQFGENLGHPWLTTITDSYSRCIIGMHLGFDAPSSQVVALALRHAILPKRYGAEFKLLCEWGTSGVPEHLFTDGGKDFRSDHLQQIAFQLKFEKHLRDRPSEGGIEERNFGTINTNFLQGFYGYLGSNVQERPEQAEEEACFTLAELHRLLVRYIVDNYNQRIDARSGNQTRLQRWEAGLPALPRQVPERELDICLKKQTRRTIYRGGYLKFENIRYFNSSLARYAGKSVILRYDPRNIAKVWVYLCETDKERFLAEAIAQNLETRQLSLAEAKAASKRIRSAAKQISNRSILAEVRDRDQAIKQQAKPSRKQRKQQEQETVHPVPELLSSAEIQESQTEKIQAQEDKRERKPRKVWNLTKLLQQYHQ